ncbi:Hypothetical predicted protein, partial [Paramuricea clavata]
MSLQDSVMESEISENEQSNIHDDAQHLSEVIKQERFETAKSLKREICIQCHDKIRFDNWLKCLKLRYWIDFGNQDKYNVNWKQKLNLEGNLVDIIITLCQSLEEDELFASQSDTDPLFSIYVDIPRMKLTIQGRYRKFWKKTEFIKLQDLVSEFCATGELTNPTASDLFTKVFYCNDDNATKSTAMLNLDGVSLDGYVVSDVESIDSNDVQTTPFTRKTRVSSPLKPRHTSNKFSKCNNKSPLKNSVQKKVKSTVSSDQSLELGKIIDHLNEINKRVDTHENFINKLDKDLALSDFEINILNDRLAEAHINDLPSTLNSHLKHELTVVRNEMNQLRDEFSTKVSKAESELIKIRGRVGSLLEEKGNLVKKVKELEIQNESLKGQVLSLHDNFVKQHSEILPPETLRAEIPPEIKVTNPTSPVTVSTPQDRHHAPITSEEISTAEPTAIQQKGNGEPQDKSLVDNKDNEIHDYDFVMLCDSNRKFLNINRLCNNRNSKMIPCNTTTKAMEIIDTPRFKVNKGLIINTGVNDVEHLTPEEIINNQIKLVEKAMSAFPNAKIILSDITPRDDKFDDEVPRINDDIDK